MRPAIDTAPNVVNPKASRARRGFAISWVAKTLVTAALIGICLHAARYAGQQGIANLITIVPPVMAQQAPLPKDDDATQLKQAVDSATAELRQSLQQEHDRAEALERELVKAWRYVGKLLSMRDGEADQFSRAVDSATASLRQSLEQEQEGPKRSPPNWRSCKGQWNRHPLPWRGKRMSHCPPGQAAMPS